MQVSMEAVAQVTTKDGVLYSWDRFSGSQVSMIQTRIVKGKGKGAGAGMHFDTMPEAQRVWDNILKDVLAERGQVSLLGK